MSIPVTSQEIELLRREKYNGNTNIDLSEDLKRLCSGEPFAYVVGWVPFLGLKIRLDSRPLIPRTETEWWTEMLIAHLNERFGEKPFRLLDLCAGSGAIGLAILARFQSAKISFVELFPEHIEQIWNNLYLNGLDGNRVDIKCGDLFGSLDEKNISTKQPSEEMLNTKFDVIACNPPYIPENRSLPRNVFAYEPKEALFSSSDGLGVVRRVVTQVSRFLDHNQNKSGELWMECDTSNVRKAARLAKSQGAKSVVIHKDQYGRDRFIVVQY